MKYLSIKGRKELLERILNEKNAYDRFVNILSRKPKFYGVDDIDLMITNHIKDTSYSGAVNGLCTWSSTKEGSDFWIGIHKKYIDALEMGGKLIGCKSIW